MRNPITKKILRFMYSNVDMLVYTNAERRAYTLEVLNYTEKQWIILNKAKQFVQAPKAALPTELKNWLDDKPYVLWMGRAGVKRNFLSFIKGMTEYTATHKVVVMGSIDEDVKPELDKLPEDFIFAKYVSQAEIPAYVDNALFSVVLYKRTSMNNWICEPNRLYQLAARGKPIIVGNNPPMKNFVESIKGGIVLLDDGSSDEFISTALAQMMRPDTRSAYIANLTDSDSLKHLYWEHQIVEVISKIREF